MTGSLEEALPRHIAVIMDGNGRWAKARGLPRTAGHRKGLEAVRELVKTAREMRIEHLTLFGFSAENWRRPEEEVTDLMHLLRFYLRSEIAELHRAGVRLSVIGDRRRLAPDIVNLIGNAEELTSGNTDLHLSIALSYGGRQEIVRATQRIAEAVQAGTLRVDEIDESSFSQRLYTDGTPDPDLLIRTSGEKRISNFLLWQCAYAELVFLDTLWPDFSRRDLEDAIQEYRRRERRFGAVSTL